MACLKLPRLVFFRNARHVSKEMSLLGYMELIEYL